MENKSNCSKFLIIGIVLVISSIFLSPILYSEYRYRKCISLIDGLVKEMKSLSDEKSAVYFEKMMILQCYGSAFGEK